jgi:beta-lactamase class A
MVIMNNNESMGKRITHWHRATLSVFAVVAATSGLNWHGGSAPGGLTVSLTTPLAAARPAESVAPPQAFQSEIAALGEAFDGRVGIAVRSVSDGWTAGYRAALPAPQQSVSKLWVAIALLDAVDHGRVSLDERVNVGLGDLTVFHQPIRGRIGPNGYSATLRELMELALTQSDNTANDMLLRRLGGSDAIRRMFLIKQIDEVKFGPGERLLQADIAGLVWKPEYSLGNSFQIARSKLARSAREEALSRYVASPLDAASPEGIVRALANLKQGELLSPESTALLLDTMASSRTGKFRLRAGVSDGWHIAHKTGTGQELGVRATGFNDVGLITSPDGKSYAVAVMIADTTETIHKRQQLIAEVARRVIAFDKASRGDSIAPSEIVQRDGARSRT